MFRQLAFQIGRVADAIRDFPVWFNNKPLTESVEKMASALENLTAAVTKLQASVDAAVTVINTPHPTDAQVQAAADAVNAQSDRLDAAVTPVPPPPPAPVP